MNRTAGVKAPLVLYNLKSLSPPDFLNSAQDSAEGREGREWDLGCLSQPSAVARGVLVAFTIQTCTLIHFSDKPLCHVSKVAGVGYREESPVL